jgi:hypothetical protein
MVGYGANLCGGGPSGGLCAAAPNGEGVSVSDGWECKKLVFPALRKAQKSYIVPMP